MMWPCFEGRDVLEYFGTALLGKHGSLRDERGDLLGFNDVGGVSIVIHTGELPMADDVLASVGGVGPEDRGSGSSPSPGHGTLPSTAHRGRQGTGMIPIHP